LTTGFEIYTQAGKGVVARFEAWPSGEPAPVPGELPQGAICVPKSGETVSGDGWALMSRRGRHALFVVDGLGHGPDAAAAARAALGAAASPMERSVTDLMAAVHDALRSTRGAAAAVALLDPEKELCTYCGHRQHRGQHPFEWNLAQHGVPQRDTRAPGAQDPGFLLSVSARRVVHRAPPTA
jgi:hypothetical protein